MSQYDDDLDSVFAKSSTVTLRKVVISVREIDMRGLKAFAKACSPFLGAFNDPDRLGIQFVDGKPVTPGAFKFFELVAEHNQAFIDAAALVTDAPRTYLERLPPDDFITIADKVVEVNSRFFAHRLAPALVRLGESLVLHLGSALSKISSPQGIESKTSEVTLTANSSGTETQLRLETSSDDSTTQ